MKEENGMTCWQGRKSTLGNPVRSLFGNACSADWQSAVSRIDNPLAFLVFNATQASVRQWPIGDTAD